MTAVERGDGVLAWRQIADQLEADISSGRLAANEKLPIEAELASRFGVNRHTVRRALATLSGKGLIRASQGRGTFVEAKPLAYPIGTRTRFTENVSRSGREAGGSLLAVAEIVADRRVAEALVIAEGEPVIRLDTLRSADGVPITMGASHLPLPRFRWIAKAYRRHRSMTRALEACGVSDYRRSETRVSARLATSDEAARLDLAPGRLVLTVDSINVDGDGVPIQFTRALFSADRTELVIESEISDGPARGR